MADLQETWNTHATNVVSGNVATLMGDFTPGGMAKAMAAVASNPIVAQSFEVNDLGGNEVEIAYIGATRRTFWSKWQETTPGKWQITDLSERVDG
ncbi:hypothetical protein AYO38_05815 [bacterium SCGC AG-212-C10]|nr:hypothetical protein AYO38_05815 [bacterium SCGC AG-212-C10]